MTTPHPESTVALAIDFGGTKVEAGLVDADGTVLTGSRFREPTGSAADSATLEAAVLAVTRAALAVLPEGARLTGAGIGCAGPISVAEGRVSPLNVPAWRDYPLLALVEREVPGITVTLRIDGICIALAEHWVGAARGESNLMGMIVSTGIGGGLIVQGRTVEGPTGNAGHIGHVEVGGFTDRCGCGGTGCVEAVASGPKSVAWAQTQGFTGTTGEDLAVAYTAGDPIARAAVERSGRAIGHAIASATALLDLDVVAIGGGFSKVTPDLFGFIRAAIDERAAFGFVTKVRIVASGLETSGPLIGAAALIHRAEYLG
jgi:glucokinase